jgi:hypothetical protein
MDLTNGRPIRRAISESPSDPVHQLFQLGSWRWVWARQAWAWCHSSVAYHSLLKLPSQKEPIRSERRQARSLLVMPTTRSGLSSEARSARVLCEARTPMSPLEGSRCSLRARRSAPCLARFFRVWTADFELLHVAK